ncbi:MAG TPA: DUF4139 domain-containing protein [Candidatus Kapabacteria bacterium]|nr:DUF4139 domain-containing protein [Candidatus Kapabacteria bacterium]
MIKYVLLLVSCFLASAIRAQSADTSNRQSVAITVYNNDLGVVRDVRKFDITDGTSEVRMADVPSRIDPTTVKITDLDHPKDLDVLEQNYEYDLVSQSKLLSKYIDKTISVTDDKGVKTEGTLLAVENDKLTLSTPNGIVMLPNLARYTISVPELSGGLITKPTLVWKLQASQALTGEPLEVLYQTGGMTWHAEYIAALSDDEKTLDLTGWVSVENNSGASFPDAKLKLVAGSLHRAPPPSSTYGARGTANALMMSQTQFQEHGLFEYHVYDLGRQTDLKNDEVKQISLLTANGVGDEKHYTYEGGKSVAVTVSFENSQANHLGIPMPMGVIRVMKRDNDGSLEFVGEDRIDHTPKDEKITLHVGDAFDLVGDRQVTSSRTLGPQSSEETVEITLKNHKDEAVTIDAVENLGENWEITEHSMDYEKRNASTIVFHVPVKANGETKVTYTVQHHW